MKLNEITHDFKEIHEAVLKKNWPLVNESSLSRAYAHTQNGQFGIITNSRAGNTPEENKRGFYELKSALRQNNLGGIVLLGHWQECSDPNIPYDQCPANLLTDVAEYSLFVPKVSFKLIKHLIAKYNQDAAIYCGPETNNIVNLIFRDGSTQPIGKFSPQKISQAYSEIHGKKGATFVFEWIAQSYIEKLITEKLK